jgi:hypothetical protein
MGGGTTAAVIAAIAAGGTLLLRPTEPIATARREVAQHNLAALFAHEDIGSWVDDENQAFARRLEEIDRRLAARGMLQSGERGHQEQEARRDQTQKMARPGARLSPHCRSPQSGRGLLASLLEIQRPAQASSPARLARERA